MMQYETPKMEVELVEEDSDIVANISNGGENTDEDWSGFY